MYAGGNDPVEGKECKRVGELLEHVLKQASVAGSSIGFRKVQPEAKPDLSLCFYIETQQTHLFTYCLWLLSLDIVESLLHKPYGVQSLKYLLLVLC